MASWLSLLFVLSQAREENGNVPIVEFTSETHMNNVYQCMACVSSPWGCQWNTHNHTCSDKDESVAGSYIIGHRKESECPRFENPDPVLIPVGHKTRISFEGIHLNNYQGHVFTIGTELMKNVEEEVKSEHGPFYTFSGFDFSYNESPDTNVLFYMKDKETGKKLDSTLTGEFSLF